MLTINRNTSDSQIMGGKACIRGMRITVALILNLFANGMNKAEIIDHYPTLEEADIDQCLQYAAYFV